ncbi:hypothetical protein NEUTE2DRAFT_134051 [Neurospora tetrasperma FGSC 2509]|nr:hypothetical protein NEUTE2DRAFT_134051 [Neurospora tetrasperma FGSC 2509]
MLPNNQNPSAQEVGEVHGFDGNSSAKGPSTPCAFTNYSSSWISSSPATATTTISSPCLIPSPSSAAAATAQKQQLQPLGVTHPVISNFVVTGTDASFVEYTTPTGATEGVLSVPSSVSKPQAKPEPDSEPEAESKSGATPIAKTTAQVTAGQDTVTASLITPRARDADFAQREKRKEEEEKEAKEAAKKSKIRKQTAAARFVCVEWWGADGRLGGSTYKKEEKRIRGKQIWISKRE